MRSRILPLRTVLPMALLAGGFLAFGAQDAAAQDAFVDVNTNLYNQFAAVPQFYKQITVIVSLLLTVTGIHGIYKGGADPRAAAPMKNIALIVLGGLMLAISSVALIAEKSTFGTNNTNVTIGGSKLDTNLIQFEPH